MDKLIYDRTQADVTYALNNPSNENFLKGAYNYTDLNRVEEWCSYLANILNSYNYNVEIITKTNWDMSNFPTSQELQRIRNNIAKLKKAYLSFTEVPVNLGNITYKKANDIEKILYEIDTLIKQMENNFVYVGVANSGQARVWQQRFRRKYIEISYSDFVDANGELFITSNGLMLEVRE